MNTKRTPTICVALAILVLVVGLIPLATYFWDYSMHYLSRDQADEPYFVVHMVQRGLFELPALLGAYILFRRVRQMKQASK